MALPRVYDFLDEQSPSGITELAFADDRFVGVGPQGLVGWSWDGLVWETSSVGDIPFVGVAWDGGAVAVSADGEAATSPDGVTWTLGAGPGVASSGSRFGAVASDGRYVSDDGSSWTLVESDGTAFEDLAFGPRAQPASQEASFVASSTWSTKARTRGARCRLRSHTRLRVEVPMDQVGRIRRSRPPSV